MTYILVCLSLKPFITAFHLILALSNKDSYCKSEEQCRNQGQLHPRCFISSMTTLLKNVIAEADREQDPDVPDQYYFVITFIFPVYNKK